MATLLVSLHLLLVLEASPATPAPLRDQVAAAGAQAGTGSPSGARVPASPAQLTRPPAPIAPGPQPLYRGTTVTYRNVGSAIGLYRPAEPTHNPYYAMQLLVAPRLWLSKQVYARGSFDVAFELTQPDAVNDRVLAGDVAFAVGYDGLYTIPRLNVTVSGELTAALPTSRASQASTRRFANGLSLSLGRKWGALSVGYTGGLDRYWHRFTTGAPTSALLGACEESTIATCVDRLVQSGRRNPEWAVSNGVNASYKLVPTLTVSAALGVSTAFLSPLPDSPEISLRLEDPSDVRHFMVSSAALTLKATDELNLVLGLRAAYAQLAPDGSYRVPLINRFTQLYLDLALNVAGLVSRLGR